MKYLFFNNHTSNVNYKNEYEEAKKDFEGAEEVDVNGLDYKAFLQGLNSEDEVIMFGGDGTLNYFINAIDGYDPVNNIYLYPLGTGNDFYFDVCESKEKKALLINEYIKDLPTVYVNGMEKKFINGIGYGIDGYCCEVGDQLKAKSDKPVNYASIAIKGVLFKYKKLKAKVVVDGEEYNYKSVWLAPTMKGRYYGGGMKVAPAQDRRDKEKLVSSVVFRGPSRIFTLIVFSSIFKGEHIKHKKMIHIVKGKEVEVTFNRPTALQIDGETVLNVTTYKVKI
ncbi:MAG: diacylglycerol kinase family protein [Bacilli bacterium]|nr:diacylglycerol kinase family protein [Bacilli bacterium]